MIKEIIKEIVDKNEYVSEYDRQYNRIARDQSAYISLVFPLVYLIMYFKENNLLGNQEDTVTYIFNCIISLALFLPALFFLYKQIIRGLSEMVTENFIFHIGNPKYIPFRNNCMSLSKKVKEALAKKLQIKFNIDINNDLINTRHLRCKDEFKSSIDQAIIQMRGIDEMGKDHIVFEYNCVYGFFRNLVGGMTLNIVIYYISNFFGVLATSSLIKDYCHVALTGIWFLFVLSLVFAWCWRIKFYKRMVTRFITLKE